MRLSRPRILMSILLAGYIYTVYICWGLEIPSFRNLGGTPEDRAMCSEILLCLLCSAIAMSLLCREGGS